MIKIGIDTNAFQGNWLAQGESFTLLADFIAKGYANAFVSEVTVLEHVRHFKQQGPAELAKIKSSISQLAGVIAGVPSPTNLSLIDTNKFEEMFRNRLKEVGIGILPIPKTPHDAMVQRDLAEKKPFDKKGKGYRDALIWLSFLDVIDSTTKNAIWVTSNAGDFGGSKEMELHPDLIPELLEKNPNCTTSRYSTPKMLVDTVVKPLLKAAAEKEAKTQEMLHKLQHNELPFHLSDVVEEGLEKFSPKAQDGNFYAGYVELEPPIWVWLIEAPENISPVAVYQLENGTFVCEGTASATASVDGFLDKFEAVDAASAGHAYITDLHWNDHYSEVEVTDVAVYIAFSFTFLPDPPDIRNFEVTTITGLGVADY
jgi:hypothetical protein